MQNEEILLQGFRVNKITIRPMAITKNKYIDTKKLLKNPDGEVLEKLYSILCNDSRKNSEISKYISNKKTLIFYNTTEEKNHISKNCQNGCLNCEDDKGILSSSNIEKNLSIVSSSSKPILISSHNISDLSSHNLNNIEEIVIASPPENRNFYDRLNTLAIRVPTTLFVTRRGLHQAMVEYSRFPIGDFVDSEPYKTMMEGNYGDN